MVRKDGNSRLDLTRRVLSAIAAFAIVLAGSATAQTSLMEVDATMRGMDALNGSPTAGYTPSRYFAPPRTTYGGGPAVRPGTMPGQMPMGMPPTGAGLATAPPAPAPTKPPVKKILVLTGERVTCHVMKTLLEDIHYEYVPEDEKGEYNDEGRDGDLQAGDNIYTKITERNDVLSPEANLLKKTYLRMLELCENTNPIEFFRIPVASDEPLSRLPRLSDEERDRDETFLRQWHSQFLKLYRRDPEDPMSDFYPVFVPSPPIPPETPPPPENDFQPYTYRLDQYIQSVIDQSVAPALTPTTPAGTYGSEYYGGGYGGEAAPEYGSGSYAPSRYGIARQQATRYQARYGTAASSSYFRR